MGRLRAGAVVSFVLCCIICFAASSSVVAAGSTDSIEDIIPSSLVVPHFNDVQQVSSGVVVPPGNEVQQVLFATGVQIYVYNSTCNWALNNVSADLYNFEGIKVGHHFYLGELDRNGGQPTWETFYPATRVTGKRLAGVTESADSIDWLLLQATTNEGKDFFGSTTFVQRLFTQHGLAPADGGSARVGDVFNSNYSSLYVFTAKN